MALLADGVHLNAWGNFVMAGLVERHLRYDPKLPTASWKDLVHTYPVGKDIKWQNGKLRLEFEGNRVDLRAAPATGKQSAPSAMILIDGKKPSQFPELYTISRPNGKIPGDWPWEMPGIMRVSHEQPLLVEDWTVKVTEISPDNRTFKFDVTGSKTGFDGSGSSDGRFVSHSGRVIIEPGDWRVRGLRWKSLISAGSTIQWQVEPHFVDVYTPPQVVDPTREYTTTIAQGLSNTRHTLEIVPTTGGQVPLLSIRVYRPPVAAQ
jgi:hypothetical protein